MNEDLPQEEKISNKLDITYVPQEGAIKKIAPDIAAIEGGKPIDDIDLKKDYITVRKNLREILMTGADAIDNILTVAKESDSPRAYEVAAQLIKAVADVNKDLLEIHQKVKTIEGGEGSGQRAANITNNSIFVGSTKDLQAIVRERYKELMETKPIDAEPIEAEVIREEEISNDGQTG
jgi:hypothetical protein